MHIPQININYIQVMSMKVILCNAVHCLQILNITDLISLLLIYPWKNTEHILRNLNCSGTVDIHDNMTIAYPRRHPYLVNQILWRTVLTKDCKLTETSTTKSHASWKTSSIYQCNIHGSCFEVVIVLRSLFSWQVLPRLANVVPHYPWPVGLSRRLVYTKPVNSMNKLFSVYM